MAHRIESVLGHRKFSLWFGSSQRFSVGAETAGPGRQVLCISAPSRLAADWINRHYLQTIATALAAEGEGAVRVQVEVVETPRERRPEPEPVPTPAQVRPEAFAHLRHRLDSFIVGPSNALAHAAASQVSDPLSTDAPRSVFLHGGCGLGKTHLLQGICRQYLDRNPRARVVYTTGEQFTNAFLDALRNHTLAEFRRKHRQVDLLAVDDVHFIAAKQQTQQEFLHCLEAADLGSARLVLAADAQPRAIQAFSDKLVSLCLQGLVVELRAPDQETRLHLIRELALRRGLQFHPQADTALAETLRGISVREIEGAVTRLHALASLQRRPGSTGIEPLGLAHVRLIGEGERPLRPARPPRFEAILEACCERLGATPKQVRSNSKHRLVCLARAASVLLARETTAMSYPEIAAAMGRSGHTTVLTAHKRLEQQVQRREPLELPGLPSDWTADAMVEELRREVRLRAAQA